MTLSDLKGVYTGENDSMYVKDSNGFIYQVNSVNGDIITVIADDGKKIDFNLSDVELII